MSPSGMDGMGTTIDAPAMLERGISGGVMSEHLDVKAGPRLKVSAGKSLDF